MGTKDGSFHAKQYESRMAPVRQQMLARLLPLFQEKDPRVLGLFLINFCAQGVGMTEPVSDWIRRAGENTRLKGYEELGNALVTHAHHEAGHHKLYIRDTHSLVGWWNDFYSPKLSPDTFLSQDMAPGVLAYRALHENTIVGDEPFCQIAIEYEIEKVSVDYGPRLFGFCAQMVGPKVLECLSFIQEHVALDVGHTQYNQRALERFLDHVPRSLDSLVKAGTAAIDTYTSYIEDSVGLSRNFLTHANA